MIDNIEMDEVKTCEERVLKELGAAEKKIKALQEEIKRADETIKYADNVLNVLVQICKLKNMGDGTTMFVGSYKFDNEKDKQFLEILNIFSEENKGAGEGGADDAEKDAQDTPKATEPSK